MAISLTVQEKHILQKVDIPMRPQALLEISAEGKKRSPDVSKIAEIIAEDPEMVTSVLQLVNSAAFRRKKHIHSLQVAVMTLGLKRLIPLIKAVALRGVIGENDELAGFWQNASLVATAAALSAAELDRPGLKDHAYMLGLFHHAGVPIMLQQFDKYEEVIELAADKGWHRVMDEEQSRYHTSHCTISALVAQMWRLPNVMTEVIYHQYNTEGIFNSGGMSDLSLDLMAILKLARYTAYCKEHHTIKSHEWELVEDDILSRFQMSQDDLDVIRERMLDELAI